ncbi:hypothetical protein B0J13DRAFT_530222 [Dactylonectria estremocensis]|uniref:Uncharacterized protein n=1 Tax=Dactylonectria estremocensis TaxID=1079267 RepID=A0A9P9ISD6_9HYPO|nr:hypothetical protein B0J13DRAFT_530222 [Dactylonectria estremocensis]
MYNAHVCTWRLEDLTRLPPRTVETVFVVPFAAVLLFLPLCTLFFIHIVHRPPFHETFDALSHRHSGIDNDAVGIIDDRAEKPLPRGQVGPDISQMLICVHNAPNIVNEILSTKMVQVHVRSLPQCFLRISRKSGRKTDFEVSISLRAPCLEDRHKTPPGSVFSI